MPHRIHSSRIALQSDACTTSTERHVTRQLESSLQPLTSSRPATLVFGGWPRRLVSPSPRINPLVPPLNPPRSLPPEIRFAHHPPDLPGTRIVSGSRDGTVRIWDANTGSPVREPLQRLPVYVRLVAFSLDGKRIESSLPSECPSVYNYWTTLGYTVILMF